MAEQRFRPVDPVSDIKYILSQLREDDKLYVGIDPGITGAISFLPTRQKIDPLVLDLPVLVSQVNTTRKGKSKKGNRTSPDDQQLLRLLDPLIDYVKQVVICLERTHPMPGDPAMVAFSMGRSYGMWHLYFAAFGFRVEEIDPVAWKRRLGLLKQEKDASRQRVMRLWPGACHLVRCVGDHNRAEALLIAEAVRQGRTEAKK